MLSQKSCGSCLGTMLRQVSLIHFTDQLPVPIALYSHLGPFRISHPIYPSLLASFWSTLMASVFFKARSFFFVPLLLSLLCSATFLFTFPLEKSNMPKKQCTQSTLTCSSQHQWIATGFRIWRLTDAIDMTPSMCVCLWQHMRLEVTSGADRDLRFDELRLFYVGSLQLSLAGAERLQVRNN